MTTEPLPTGPDPEAITRPILETWGDTGVIEALGARILSLGDAPAAMAAFGSGTRGKLVLTSD